MTDWLDRADRLRRRIAWRLSARLADDGVRTVALWGDGPQARALARQPWAMHGIRVVGRGTPPTPTLAPDAVVVCVDAHESDAAAEAAEAFPGTRLERLYGPSPDDPACVWDAERLATIDGVSPADAAWLVANRVERHDATLPMLPPVRTELHLRRYELASTWARGAHAVDAACGTGYGSAMLRAAGAASVVGIDIDAEAVAYAGRRHAASGVTFRVGDTCDTGLPDDSIGLFTSMETIEHLPEPERFLAEVARVLAPGGRLVMTTPRDGDFTDFHVQSFDAERVRGLLAGAFEIEHELAQRAGDEPMGLTSGAVELPAGVFPAADAAIADAETMVFVAVRRG